MDLWMDPLGDPLTTRPIETGWEFTIELYPSWLFRFIDNPDSHFGKGSLSTRTQTRSDSPEPLLQPRVVHFGYPKMNHLSHKSEWIWRMGSSDNFTTDSSEWLHIANVKDAYRSSNNVSNIRQMLKHNDRCTGLDYTEETLSYLALQGCYEIHSAKVFNLLSATNRWRNTCRAHLSRLQTIEDEPFIRLVSQQVYHLREMHVRGVCRSTKLTSLRDASDNFRIPNFGQ